MAGHPEEPVPGVAAVRRVMPHPERLGRVTVSDLLGRATALAGGAHFRSKQSIYYKIWLLYKSRLGQYHPSRLVLTPPLGRKPQGKRTKRR